MYKIVLIALGGAIGALLRFFVTKFISGISQEGFPWATFVVNLIGCLIIGLLWVASERTQLPAITNAFIFIGILGAFTTFSSYGLESFQLLQNGKIFLGFGYIVLSNIFGLAAVWLGKIIGNSLFP